MMSTAMEQDNEHYTWLHSHISLQIRLEITILRVSYETTARSDGKNIGEAENGKADQWWGWVRWGLI